MDLEPQGVRRPPGRRPPAPPTVDDAGGPEERTFGQAIRDERQARALTRQEFAKAFGFSLTYLGQIEDGKRVPTRAVIVDVAEGLGLPEAELIGLAEQHPRYWPRQLAGDLG